jgi:hypothetical protein
MKKGERYVQQFVVNAGWALEKETPVLAVAQESVSPLIPYCLHNCFYVNDVTCVAWYAGLPWWRLLSLSVSLPMVVCFLQPGLNYLFYACNLGWGSGDCDALLCLTH